MPFFGSCWRGARTIASSVCGLITNGFKKIYTRATRRRHNARALLNEPNDGVRRVEIRPAFNILQKGALKRCIYKIQANDRSITSVPKLLERLEQEMNFKGNPATLRRLLHELGLFPIVSSNNKEYFLEKKRTRSMRTKYLQNVAKYRKEGRPIIYTALSSVKLPRIRDLLDHRAVMAYAATESGVIKDAITVFRYNMPIEQWYYMIRYERYEDWIRTDLMPNLPPNSVIVMRNTPWNKTAVKKTAMEAWLQERRIPFEPDATKSELRKLININKEKFEHKTIDEILKANNHTVLRLPSFHDDLNPLEVIWMRVQQHVAKEKIRNNLDQVVSLTHDRLAMVDKMEMSEQYHKISLIESGYRISEMYADAITNRIAFQESLASSSSSIDCDAGNIMFYDCDDEQPGPSTSLAIPDEN